MGGGRRGGQRDGDGGGGGGAEGGGGARREAQQLSAALIPAGMAQGIHTTHKGVIAHEGLVSVELVQEDYGGGDGQVVPAARRGRRCGQPAAPTHLLGCLERGQARQGLAQPPASPPVPRPPHICRRCPASMIVLMAVRLKAATWSGRRPSRWEGDTTCISWALGPTQGCCSNQRTRSASGRNRRQRGRGVADAPPRPARCRRRRPCPAGPNIRHRLNPANRSPARWTCYCRSRRGKGGRLLVQTCSLLPNTKLLGSPRPAWAESDVQMRGVLGETAVMEGQVAQC